MKVERIFEAFSARKRPEIISVCTHGSAPEDYEDALYFDGKLNTEVTASDFESHPDCVFGFSPAAYVYFLPSIFAVTVAQNNPRILVVHSIIAALDRGNAPNTWDGFFADRWPLLTKSECEVTQGWLLWLAEFEHLSFDQISLGRAFDTIQLLADKSAAYPIARLRRAD